ncbi:hypothetical protein KO527_00635 [Pseudoalteromonas sp. C2R02]|uniref:hypothetical protein n=1 Tax=Pseudoalteromonas sp. C2R02 TaxID=2841565 RepID=UPI001C09A14D|nr:hypothetical protein [Pseudoalteromonas sp. C2R02]MBU2967869.1 hypothetical protein [Pseudoalteromonas sp. C2R02]
MRKLLTLPAQMSLSDAENLTYENALKQATEISLNLMAVKVENHPEDFSGWCHELIDICTNRINFELLEQHQLPFVKKLNDLLVLGVSVSQLKMLKITPWPIMASFIEKNAKLQALDEKLALLSYLKITKQQTLSEMIQEDRLAFAGKHTASHDPSIYKFDVEWFGSTKSAKNFHQLLQNNPELLDKALANIPTEGDVSEQDYQNFVIDYLAAHYVLDDVKPTLAPATRLLAMHRPDIFLPLTNSKLDSLCAAFEVPKLNNKDFDRYYKDIIQAMHVMPWYRAKCPETELEQQLWSVRALLPTLFYYVDENTASNSNYLKLLNKPKRATKTGTTRTKRGKESAEILVDRALEADDIPEHIKSKRDSIIAEVVKGRTVAETISLMRMIFG